MLLLASGSLIAPVFASILRSVEKRVSNLLVDLLTTGSLLGFHLAGLAHSILESGAESSTCFLLSKHGPDILTAPRSTNPGVGVCVFQFAIPPHPPPHASLFPWLWAPGEERNPRSDTPDLQQATCFGEHQADCADPPASQSLGRGGAGTRGGWLWLSRGVRSRPGKMPLGTDSPTSSRVALVGDRCLALWCGGIRLIPLSPPRLCPGS